MGNPRIGRTENGQLMHYAVGALIRKDGKFLLVDRKKPPFGFAGITGHIEEGEDEATAIAREVTEKSGLKISDHVLLFKELIDWSECNKGSKIHAWSLFECHTDGEIEQNFIETKSIGWYTIDQIRNMPMEPVWKYWFERLGLL